MFLIILDIRKCIGIKVALDCTMYHLETRYDSFGGKNTLDLEDSSISVFSNLGIYFYDT